MAKKRNSKKPAANSGKNPPKQEAKAEPALTATASTVPHEAPAKKIQRTSRRRLVVSLLVLMIILFGACYWYFVVRPGDPVRANQTVLSEVSKLAVVPDEEVPAVTTVVDESKINQEFLRGSQKGDKVLLFFQAGRAVVYRPSTHQIVNMGPLQTPKPRVFVRNGSTAANTDKVANLLRASPDYLLVSRDDSPRTSYQSTIVVDVTGQRSDIATRLAALLHAKVAGLPDGESKPDADMLVIVGKNAAQ